MNRIMPTPIFRRAASSGLGPESGETLPTVNANDTLTAALAERRQEIVGGLLYTHSRANAGSIGTYAYPGNEEL